MIWLAGCNGMLGCEVSRQLKSLNLEAICTGRELDITDFNVVKAFVQGKKIGFIINCAAYTDVDKAESEYDKAFILNVTGPENLSRIASETGAVFIHISTDYVFDGKDPFPITEDEPVFPAGVYGKTKALGENAVSENAEKFYILRTSWLYGWAGKNFVYTMIRAMNFRESVKVVNDQKGAPTFAGNLAKIIVKIIEKGREGSPVPYGIYHCTDSGEISWWDFANEIKKQGIETDRINSTGRKCKIIPCTTEEYPLPSKRPSYSVLSCEKIQKALAISLPDWKDGLRLFLSSELFDSERIR